MLNFRHADPRKLGVMIEMPGDSFNCSRLAMTTPGFNHPANHLPRYLTIAAPPFGFCDSNLLRISVLEFRIFFPRHSTILAASYTLRPWLRPPRPKQRRARLKQPKKNLSPVWNPATSSFAGTTPLT